MWKKKSDNKLKNELVSKLGFIQKCQQINRASVSLNFQRDVVVVHLLKTGGHSYTEKRAHRILGKHYLQPEYFARTLTWFSQTI